MEYTRYHVEATYEMANRISGCRMDNGNFKNVFNVANGECKEFEKNLSDDNGVLKYYTS
jgi:hypothetical protein